MSSREKSRPSLFWLLAVFVVPVVSLLMRIQLIDRHKLPTEGAYVLAPNHVSELDPLTVAVAVWRMGRAPRFMAKESLFKVPVLGAVLRATGMVPVSRTAGAAAVKQAMMQAEALVKNGRGVVVYPEGTLTRDPDMWPMRGKTGAVRLALAGDIPLIPMAHWGTQQVLGRYAKRISLWPLRKPAQVIVGDRVDLSDLKGRAQEPAALIEATDRLMGAIAELLAQIRKEKAPTKRWNPAEHGQKETGRLEP